MNPNRTIASLAAAHRSSERQAATRYKHYATQVRAERGLAHGAPVPHSSESSENYIEMLSTLHRDAAISWNWSQIAASPPPAANREREAAAQGVLDAYKPAFFERLLGQADKRHQEFASAVAHARAADDAAWREVCEQWNWCQQVAQLILQGDLRAYRTAIEHFSPFEELEWLGMKVDVQINEPSLAVALVTVRDDAVPMMEYKVLASGRVSPKEMPRTRYRELCQAYVCSAAIRVARELFSLLPIPRVLVHAVAVRLDPATGHSGPRTLLSVDFDRERLLNVNFDRIEPSFAVESFRHAMDFKKSVGLLPVEALEPLAQLSSLDEAPARRRR